jgi:hypothetical protein
VDISTVVYINQNKSNFECQKYSYVSFVVSVTRVPLPIRLNEIFFITDVCIIDAEVTNIIVSFLTHGTNNSGSNGVTQRAA